MNSAQGYRARLITLCGCTRLLDIKEPYPRIAIPIERRHHAWAWLPDCDVPDDRNYPVRWFDRRGRYEEEGKILIEYLEVYNERS